MSGKPPTGKGNKRWNLGNSSNKSNEKRDLTKAIDDIYNILEGDDQILAAKNLSEVLLRLSKMSIPNKQTNLTKEIASSCRALGKIPIQMLKPSDYASISRYLTRASAEKQLSLTAREAPLMYNLFAHFLHSIRFQDNSEEHQSKLVVLHEVMRAFAQLISEGGSHLYGKKSDLFELLYLYTSLSCHDLETRFSAIDVLGNFFKSASVIVIESSVLQTDDSNDQNVEEDANDVVKSNQSISASISISNEIVSKPLISKIAEKEIQFLQVHLRKCLSLLIENLQFCEHHISNNSSFLEGGGEDSLMIQKLLISVFRAIVYAYSSPFACFKGISTAVGKPTVLGEVTWRLDLFRDYLDSIFQSFIPILNYCIQSSPSNSSHSSKVSGSFEDQQSVLDCDDADNTSLPVLGNEGWRSASSPRVNSQFHDPFTPRRSRPASPANSVCSAATLSPNRGKRHSLEENREKILQHAFYLVESLAKFDCAASMKFWPILFHDTPSSKTFNLFDYLNDEIQYNLNVSDGNKKYLTPCAEAISALFVQLPTVNISPSDQNYLPIEFVINSILRNLPMLLLTDNNSIRITEYLSIFSGILDYLSALQKSLVGVETCLPKWVNCCRAILAIIMHRSLQLTPHSSLDLHISSPSSLTPHDIQKITWTIPHRKSISQIHVATSLLVWLTHRVLNETSSLEISIPVQLTSEINLNVSRTDYLSSLLNSADLNQHSNSNANSTWQRSSHSSPDNLKILSHLPSRISIFQLLLDRSHLLDSLLTASSIVPLDPDSDLAKEESAILSLISAISQVDLPILFPYFHDIGKLLSPGFSFSRPEVRVLCLGIVGSCTRHTSQELPHNTTIKSWKLVKGACSVEVEIDAMLNLIQAVLASSNDVEAMVRIQSIQSMKDIAVLWHRWRTQHPSTELKTNVAFFRMTEIYLQICRLFAKLLSDSSIDVAITACKTFGDLIVHTSLWIDCEIFSFILSTDRQSINSSLVQLSQACLQSVDSLLTSPKIPIRVQAIWTFGNIIKNLLPYRILTISEEISTSSQSTKRGHMIGNIYYSPEDWIPSCSTLIWDDIRIKLIERIEYETEKIIPAAVRALSLVTCGLIPQTSHAASYSHLISLLLFGSHSTLLVFTSWQTNWTSEFIIQHILEHKVAHHKLLYSICQLLCSYLWSVLLYSDTISFNEIQINSIEYFYQLLHCLFRQNHFIKIRIQSVKILIVIHQFIYEKFYLWIKENTTRSMEMMEFYLKFCVKCVEDTLLLLLNWTTDIPSQIDLTNDERNHLREYLIYLLNLSLHCIQLSFNFYSLPYFMNCRNSLVSVLYHSILDFVSWLQNEEIIRFQIKENSSHYFIEPLTIDTILEIEIISHFIPSSPHYHSNLPNSNQFDYLIIQSINELITNFDYEENSQSYHFITLFYHKINNNYDVVKELSLMILNIFQSCHQIEMLQSSSSSSSIPPSLTMSFLSLEASPSHSHSLPLHQSSFPLLSSSSSSLSLSLSSSLSSPYEILLSICDPIRSNKILQMSKEMLSSSLVMDQLPHSSKRYEHNPQHQQHKVGSDDNDGEEEEEDEDEI